MSTVSYTHLDVYKRQSLWDVDSGSIKIGGVDVKELAFADFNRKIAYAVSYTHLDVYKRQEYIFGRSFIVCNLSF